MIRRQRRWAAAAAAAIVPATALVAAPAPRAQAPAGGERERAIAGSILETWPARQAPNGAFVDPLRDDDALGRQRGWDEAVTGAVLLSEGLARDDEELLRSGLRFIAWQVDPANHTERALNRTVFETYFVASAYAEAQAAGLLEREPELAARWRDWLVARRPILLGEGRRWSNQLVVEAAGVAQMMNLALPDGPPGAIADDRAVGEQLIATFERAAREPCRSYRDGEYAAFSDGPKNPPAYQVISAAFLARYVDLRGPLAPPELEACVRGLVLAIEAMTAPDGELAYAGRSQAQSWVPAVGAAVALRQAEREHDPAVAARMRALAGRYVDRLAALHMTEGDRLLLTPLVGRVTLPDTPRRREAQLCGMDHYASTGTYEGLTALGLLWSARLGGGDTAAAPVPPLGGRVLSRGESTAAILARTGVWGAVRPVWAPTRRRPPRHDMRYDGGLVRLKVRRAGVWTDLLPLLPRTELARPSTLLPARWSRGRLLLPRARLVDHDGRTATVALRYADGSRARMIVALTVDGARIRLLPRRAGRWRIGALSDGPLQPIEGGFDTSSARHTFRPAPASVQASGFAYASGESPRLTRHLVELKVPRSGGWWRIAPRPSPYPPELRPGAHTFPSACPADEPPVPPTRPVAP